MGNYLSRRKVLKAGGGAVLAAGLIGLSGWSTWFGFGGKTTRLPARRRGESLLDYAARVFPEVTSNEDFYVLQYGFRQPRVEPAPFRLRVVGLVERPLSLSLEELKTFPQVSQYATLTCVGNPVGGGQIGNALWGGVRVRDLLGRAGLKVQGGGGDLVLRALDGYHDSFPISKALEPGTVLAHRMNGGPLPREHGFPLRCIVPDIYGMKNVKWVHTLEVVGNDHKGYWQERGWSDGAIVHAQSRFERPARRVTVDTSPLLLVGTAFAGARGIRKVEVSADGRRTWKPAALKVPLSPYSWQLWAYELPLPRDGDYRLWVRAVDGRGVPQEEERRPAFPDGATGLASLHVRARGLAAS